MTLKKFNADLSSASQKTAAGAVPGVQSIGKGHSEGELVINYRHESLTGNRVVPIQALAQNVDEYPDGNAFMLFTEDEDAPEPVDQVITSIENYLFGMRVYEMITELSSRFQAALEGEASQGVSDSEEQDYDMDDDDAFGLTLSEPAIQPTGPLSSPYRTLMRQRMRRDLRRAKQAGYKVGLFDDMRHTGTQGIVSISIRAQKLGLSEEAMEAWDVEQDEYIVLLIRFDGYTPVERIVEQASEFTQALFCIGKCTRYKPSFKEALAAFAEQTGQSSESPHMEGEPTTKEPTTKDAFRKMFVSNSLNRYLNECFVSLLKLRVARKCSWDEANLALDSKKKEPSGDAPSSLPGDPMEIDSSPEDHGILASDHLAQNAPEHGHSLPLVAMEFAMHYFVRCTNYCLCCHQKVGDGFEALRPYVCPKPLCLFQYMAMGFGPNIEHEILTEPYVVDLLVSLCYAALVQGTSYTYPSTAGRSCNTSLRIRELPVGLPMKVPGSFDSGKASVKAFWTKAQDLLSLDADASSAMVSRLSPGTWIAFRLPGESTIKHAVVVGLDPTGKHTKIKTMYESTPVWSPYENMTGAPPPPKGALANAHRVVQLYFYDTDLDSLPDHEKGRALRAIIDTIPPIREIAAFLSSHPHSSVRSMDDMSPAAASVLQWIVSSNRSCIFQVDNFDDDSQRETRQRTEPSDGKSRSKMGKNRAQERIPGMPGWIQFRFAQGSPDKERRFRLALQDVAARKPTVLKHPTIFAWHGSVLSNWHSIVRNGLDSQQVANGRAFGDGVYFSREFNTSSTYAQPGGELWPNSALKITTCLSLNEIINSPAEFQSRSPHYVVPQPDWHQCRYLFAKSDLVPRPETKNPSAAGQQFHPQAPDLEIIGPHLKALSIPLAAIPLRLVSDGSEAQSLSTKRTSVRLEEDESAEEDPEDVDFLFSDGESDETRAPPSKKMATATHPRPDTPANTDSLTDFQPGALDISQLHTMEAPTFATDMATKRLGQELAALQKTQSKTPIHELGWYMDFERMENMYHWIVEFHSFDPSLPLARDMKKLGVTSIVFEVRFGKNFPITPPFVRVIQPRFLPFLAGGGGHVTAGGAMCMELLTNSGWSPVSSMESVFLQVRMALCSLDPRPARLEDAVNPRTGTTSSAHWNGRSYGVAEAIDAYMRAAMTHGWAVPSDLHETAKGV